MIYSIRATSASWRAAWRANRVHSSAAETVFVSNHKLTVAFSSFQMVTQLQHQWDPACTTGDRLLQFTSCYKCFMIKSMTSAIIHRGYKSSAWSPCWLTHLEDRWANIDLLIAVTSEGNTLLLRCLRPFLRYTISASTSCNRYPIKSPFPPLNRYNNKNNPRRSLLIALLLRAVSIEMPRAAHHPLSTD